MLTISILLAVAGYAQVAAPAAFETVSVKSHAIAPGSYLIKNYPHAPPFVVPTGNTFAETAHAEDLIMEAYGLSEYQILYLPAWARSRDGLLYDIETKAKGNTVPTPAEFEQMMQAMLADRFHLKVHRETKTKFSVYALVPDKKGPKFKEFTGSAPVETSAGSPFAGTTIFALAHFLSPNLDFPVIDGTEYGNKRFDFDIDNLVDFHEVDREQRVDPMEAQDYLRSAVLNVLGLKLESRKIDVEVLSIDHIDEPSTH